MKMTLCRTKDGCYLRAAGRETAPEGAEVVEPSKLNPGGLQAAISALDGRPCGRPESKTAGLRRLGKLLAAPELGQKIAQQPKQRAAVAELLRDLAGGASRHRQAEPIAARPLHPEFQKPSRGAAASRHRLLWKGLGGFSAEIPL